MTGKNLIMTEEIVYILHNILHNVLDLFLYKSPWEKRNNLFMGAGRTKSREEQDFGTDRPVVRSLSSVFFKLEYINYMKLAKLRILSQNSMQNNFGILSKQKATFSRLFTVQFKKQDSFLNQWVSAYLNLPLKINFKHMDVKKQLKLVLHSVQEGGGCVPPPWRNICSSFLC